MAKDVYDDEYMTVTHYCGPGGTKGIQVLWKKRNTHLVRVITLTES